MTSLDRTPGGTALHGRNYGWVPLVTTLATLATVLILAFTGNDEAAIAVAATGFLGSIAIQVTIIRR